MKFKNCLKILLCIALWMSTYNVASAAKLYFSTSTLGIASGQTGQITVYLDTEGKKAYGVEGYIEITGSSVEFTSVNAAGVFSESDLDSDISDDLVEFRIDTDDETLEGVEAIVTIGYRAVSAGTTTLAFETQGNFGSSLVAEDVTGDDILTSTEDIVFTVSSNGGGGGTTAVCGDGVKAATEQCDYAAANPCGTGYTCSTSCTCVFASGATITPILTGSANTPIVTPISTPRLLPNSDMNVQQAQVLFLSVVLLGIGTALLLIKKNLIYINYLGRQIKIDLRLLKINKVKEQNNNYERNFSSKNKE